MSRPPIPYPPSKAELEALRKLNTPLPSPDKIKRRCKLCGLVESVNPEIQLYCKHGGEWMLMERVDGVEEESSSLAI
jgi:hypothetical protein